MQAFEWIFVVTICVWAIRNTVKLLASEDER